MWSMWRIVWIFPKKSYHWFLAFQLLASVWQSYQCWAVASVYSTLQSVAYGSKFIICLQFNFIRRDSLSITLPSQSRRMDWCNTIYSYDGRHTICDVFGQRCCWWIVQYICGCQAWSSLGIVQVCTEIIISHCSIDEFTQSQTYSRPSDNKWKQKSMSKCNFSY